MKKPAVILLLIFGIAVLFTACGQTADVTWEQLCKANRIEAVLEKAGACQMRYDDMDSVWSIAETDGEVIWSQDNGETTEDYRGGAIYRYVEDHGVTSEVTFLSPDNDCMKLAQSYFDLGLEEAGRIGEIRLQNGRYKVRFRSEDDEYGIVVVGKAVYDASTLLLESMEARTRLGMFGEKSKVSMKYGPDITFAQRSYEAITQADDAMSITLYNSDGTVSDYCVSAKSEVAVYGPQEGPYYSLCWDEAGTGRVDDLAWVEGEHANLYVHEGEVPLAPPTMSRIMERSRFDYLFEVNYDSYSQSFTYYDNEDNWCGGMELVWILNEESEMEYYAEASDGDGEVIFSEMGVDGVWYSWTADKGYRVDFYGDSGYAEKRMDPYRFCLNEEHLYGQMQEDDYGWHICHSEEEPDGTRIDYDYKISSDFDYIDRVIVNTYDSAARLTGITEVYIGGNGGIPVNRCVRDEITSPEEMNTVNVIVANAGNKSVSIRSDAAIGWEGAQLYADEDCFEPIAELSSVSSDSVAVYAK